jgi:ADP-ribose pyrophosphatase YjhB (NUDIX family)
MKEITVKAMCLFEKNGKILVNSGFDQLKNERFFRLIGGRVNFGEKTEDALRREIKEELDSEIENLQFLTVIENIFQYQGKKRHEICFIYKGNLVNKEIYKKERIHNVKNGERFDAEWVPVENILEGKMKLYPSFNYRKLFALIF